MGAYFLNTKSPSTS
uniref:Uncharacterized protein n=1 Tax=Arundo donax TaxID=35708 RepID=A0A0A9C574_ARUDO